jgi:hypothetical protein
MDRPMTGRRVALALLPVALACFAPGPRARAHVVYGTATLHQLVATSDVVARAHILDTAGRVALEAPGMSRPVVEARLLEVMKGPAEPGVVRFAQHGHGVAPFEAGEEVLLFLRRIERHRELARLGSAGALAYVSLQEHDAKFLLTRKSRDAVLSAARSYAQVGAVSDPAARHEALRRATFAQLASPDGRISGSAVRDLVLAEEPPLITEADLPVLEPILASPATPIGVRIALLAELERRGLVDGPTRWVELLRGTRGRELQNVIRAAGAHPSPPTRAVLLEILAGDDSDAAAAAAMALGEPGNDTAVAPLYRALSQGDERLRMASIRGLGRIATASARKVLEEASRSHPDPATRRRAGAEVKLLERAEPSSEG